MRKLGFCMAFLLPAITVAGFYAEGWANYSTLLFIFLIIPVADSLVGIDRTNVPSSQQKAVSDERFYRFVTYVWLFVQIAFLGWAALVVSTHELAVFEWVGLTISVGLVTGGIGITVAHELGHKKAALERTFSKLLLMTVCYMHFYIEHNRGHHVAVATPEDPATSRVGESVYAFWFRSVTGSFLHAWLLEKTRLQSKGLPAFHHQNAMIWFTLLPLLFGAALVGFVWLMTGVVNVSVFLFFIAQSVIAFTLLELVNYIEHYGMLRKEVSPGRYERVNPLHSWNASHLISNFFLFQLQRHSDHHTFAHKRYQVLDHFDESPQLPFGYPTMIILSLVPPLWFSLMDRRLQAWQQTLA